MATPLATVTVSKRTAAALGGDGSLASGGERRRSTDRVLGAGLPNDADASRELSVAHFRRGNVEEGIRIARELLHANPFDVLTQAYLGSFLHEIGDDLGCAEVFAFEDQVVTQRLFADAKEEAAINDRLADAILRDPNLAPGRPGKATRFGRQTREIWPALDILASDFTLRLRRAVATELRAFGLPVPADEFEATHFKITAWGVVLGSGGFQGPHVHPSGLLSGVYYVRVPQLEGAAHAGQLRFRKAPPWVIDDCLPDDATRHVVPTPGQLVMFPSYFWHDTLPFESRSPRISLAFDVLAPNLDPKEHE